MSRSAFRIFFISAAHDKASDRGARMNIVTNIHYLAAEVSFTDPTNTWMYSHSKSNCLETIPLLPCLGAGQMVSVTLIVTETHSGGITLHRQKLPPVFV